MKLILFIFSLSLSLWSRGVQAYSFTTDIQKGYYWAALPIAMKKFVVDESEGPQLEQLVKESENEWEVRTGREIWDIETGVSTSFPSSGNFIRWSYNFAAETGYDPNGTLAVTVRVAQGTYITRTEIILNGELDYLRQNWGGTLRKTILHELGHTVGLGHSENVAIMGKSLSSVGTIQEDDENGMNALVDEIQYRQQTGYVSPHASEEEFPIACGSVDINNNSNGGGTSLFVGFFLSMILFLRRPTRQILPLT